VSLLVTKIRDGRLSDAPQIKKLWKEAMDYHKAISDEDYRLDRDSSRYWMRFFKADLKSGDSKLLVAEKDDVVIGYLLGQSHSRPQFFQTKRCGFIGELTVMASERRSGVGTQLFSVYVEWAKKRKLPYINLFVAHGNKAGFSFWKKMGFGTVMVEQRKGI